MSAPLARSILCAMAVAGFAATALAGKPPVFVEVFEMPSLAIAGKQIEITGQVAGSKLPESLSVTIQQYDAAGGKWVGIKTIDLAPDGESASFAAKIDLKKPQEPAKGPWAVSFRASLSVGKEPLPAQTSAVAHVTLLDRKCRVLLVASRPMFEYRYLSNLLLARSEMFSVTTFLQSADADANADVSSGPVPSSLPTDAADLVGDGDKKPGFDVVILLDPRLEPGKVDEKFFRAVDTAVRDKGLGLVYVASDRNTMTLLDGSNKDIECLRKLVGAARTESTKSDDDRAAKPLAVEVSDDGRCHPVMRLQQTRSVAAGAQLPGIYFRSIHPDPKSDSTILATVSASQPAATAASGPLPPAATAPAPEAGASPVVWTRQAGAGRVVVFATDEMWRWRAILDSSIYNALWTDAIQFTAVPSDYQIHAGRTVLAAGDQTALSVLAKGGKDLPATLVLEAVNIADPAAKPQGIEVKLDAKTLTYRGQWKAGGDGLFRISIAKDGPVGVCPVWVVVR